MKKTLTSAIAAALVFVSLNSFASSPSSTTIEETTKSMVETFVTSLVNCTVSYDKKMFANNFEYINTANNNKLNKKQFLKLLEQNKGLEFDAKTSYEILEETNDICIAKSVCQFSDFSRVDYITLAKTGEGWKITKVMTTYP